MLDKLEVKTILLGKKNLSKIHRNPEMVCAIMTFTDFLPEETSLPLRMWCIMNDISSIPVCPVCSELPVTITASNRFAKTCSKECSNKFKIKAMRDTVMDKYGVSSIMKLPEARERAKKTCMERYGVENYTQTDEYKENFVMSETHKERLKEENAKFWSDPTRVDAMKANKRETFLANYGEEWISNVPEIKEKVKKTQFDNHGRWYLTTPRCEQQRVDAFGASNYFQTDEFKKQMRDKNMVKYGTHHHLQNAESFELLSNREWLLSEYSSKPITEIAETVGVCAQTVWRWLQEYGIDVSIHANDKISFGEREVIEFVEGMGLDIETGNRKLIAPYELDIYIPEKKVAIEFNGVYWHSSKIRDKEYHQRKSLMCKELGILLIHVWSDDWRDRKDVVKKMIASKLIKTSGIFARKCSVGVVQPKDAKTLYDGNHLQGFVRASAHIGLFYEDKLVACSSFIEKSEGVWEILRFSSSTRIVGGFSKILRFFQDNYKWERLFTFAHLDHSHGALYISTGFEEKHTTKPSMWYVRGDNRYRREKFMKHKLSKLFDGFDPNMTEAENMQKFGYGQLFDSGVTRYELTRIAHHGIII